MIGILLSEAVELVYTLGKWTYCSGKLVYEWYYDIHEQTDLEKKIENLQNQVIELQQKIKKS